MKHDLTTTAGASAMLADLAQQHENARSKLGALNKRRESLALDAAGGDEQALVDLRALGDEEALIKRSMENILAAKKAAGERHEAAADRERIADLNALYDVAESSLAEILSGTGEVAEAADRLVAALRKRKVAGERLQGTRVAGEMPHYFVSGQGVLDHLAALGLRDLVQGFTHMSGDRLEQRDPTVGRLPSREIFLRMNGVEQ